MYRLLIDISNKLSRLNHQKWENVQLLLETASAALPEATEENYTWTKNLFNHALVIEDNVSITGKDIILALMLIEFCQKKYNYEHKDEIRKVVKRIYEKSPEIAGILMSI